MVYLSPEERGSVLCDCHHGSIPPGLISSVRKQDLAHSRNHRRQSAWIPRTTSLVCRFALTAYCPFHRVRTSDHAYNPPRTNQTWRTSRCYRKQFVLYCSVLLRGGNARENRQVSRSRSVVRLSDLSLYATIGTNEDDGRNGCAVVRRYRADRR